MAEYYPIIWLSEGGDAVQIGASTMSRESAIALAKRLLAVLDPAPVIQKVRRQRMSADEKADIVARYSAGEGPTAIAMSFRRDISTIVALVRAAGIAPQRQASSLAAKVLWAARRNGGAAP